MLMLYLTRLAPVHQILHRVASQAGSRRSSERTPEEMTDAAIALKVKE